MKVSIIILLICITNILYSTEYEKDIIAYSADYTTGELIEVSDRISIDENKYYSKVVLDKDNVYRLKVFKKELSTTPEIIKKMVNLEDSLSKLSKINFDNNKKEIISSL